MNGSKVLVLAAVSAALIAAIYFFNNESPTRPPASVSPVRTETPAASVGQATSTTTTGDVADVSTNPDSRSAAIESNADDGQIFHVAGGNLVVNEQTRLNIEALVAQIEPSERDEAVREHTEQLPPGAARQAEELVAKFVSYQQAHRQNYAPDDAPATYEDAERQLEGLHALREAHFGPEVARQFYEREEIIAHEMIEVMRVESDQSLTPEEKAERARALRERLPGISAIEKNNRNSDAVRQEQQRK